MSRRCLSGWIQVAAIAVVVLLTAPSASAANFQFGTMIRAGQAGGTDWELGVGASSSAPSNTGNKNPYYGANQLFEIGYVNSSNTAYVRVHQNTSSASSFNQVSFNPAGGGGPVSPTTVWRLPASSFFAQATDASGINLIQISGLTLSGISGAVNVIQPLVSTSMTAYQIPIFGLSRPTVTQSQDLIFQADSGGNWRLTGVLTLLGLSSNGGVASGSELAFGVGALSVDTPEPGSLALLSMGVAGMVAFARRRSVRK